MLRHATRLALAAILGLGACAVRLPPPPPPPPPDPPETGLAAPVSPPPLMIPEDPPCPDDPRVVSCEWLRPTEPIPFHLALATREGAIMAAWTTNNYTGSENRPLPTTLSLASLEEGQPPRLSAIELGVIPFGVSMVGTPRGWTLAVSLQKTLAVFALRPNGEPRSAPVELPRSIFPHLVVESDGSALLTYGPLAFGPRRIFATRLDPDGQPLWSVKLADGALEYTSDAAVVSDGFLVTLRQPKGIEVIHLRRDGSIGARRRDFGEKTHSRSWRRAPMVRA